MYLTGFTLRLSSCLDLGIVNVATIKRGLALALSSPSLIIWFASAGGAIFVGPAVKVFAVGLAVA
jgi:hypothetical protein